MGKNIFIVTVVLFLLLTHKSHSANISCSTSMTDIDFGSIDFTNFDMSKINISTLNYRCINNSSVMHYLNACFYIGGVKQDLFLSNMHSGVSDNIFFRLKSSITDEELGTGNYQSPIRIVQLLAGNSEISGVIPIKGEVYKKNS
ncbi:hypothetical protein [Serratia sp. N21D137]|uniref:hypothetical protein n=1 Tax=Serratia sp. N21D137 TaxID=3397495 RepID=UPI0039E14F12